MAEHGTMVTRRSLLQMSWCAAALAGVAGAGRYLNIWKRPKQRLKELTAESFRPYEGQQFVFSRPREGRSILSQSVGMKLTGVSVHERVAQMEAKNPARYAGKRSRKSFSLVFELKDGAPLGNGLHRLNHGDFDGCELFLSQISRPRPDGTLQYEAVFG